MRLRSYAVLLLLLLGPSIAKGDDPTVSDPLKDLQLLRGPWDGGTIHRESVLFLKGKDGSARANLLYDVDRILSIKSPDGSKSFEVDRDYRVSPDASGLTLTADSRIPSIDESDLFRPKGSPGSIGHRADHPETSVLFDNAHFFHDKQVEVSYIPRDPKWAVYRPTFASEALPRTLEKLKKKQPLTIALSGDSISEGYNASAYTKVAPFMPAYPALIPLQLETTYGSKIAMHNLAIAGWSSGQGLKEVENLLKTKPDLVIIAYGMNDVGQRNPESYKANIKGMLDRIHKEDPAIEVILVSTMTGNPDWMATPAEMFPKYRDALASLVGPGVAFVDMTAIWQRLLARKHHTSLTGNGVNHPNDHGHRVYAQAILALLIDPAMIERPGQPGR